MKRIAMIVMVAAALAGPGVAHAETSFADPAGDSGAAPDVTGVTVSNDQTGIVTFRLRVANQPDLAADGEVVLVIDSDRNETTGDAAGFDYVLILSGSERSWLFGRWNGTDFDFDTTPSNTVRVSYTAGLMTFSVNRSELASTAAFSFYVLASQIDAAGEIVESDDAPDDGTYAFALTISTRTFTSAATLPAEKRYTGARSIKHSRLTQMLYRTLKGIGVPRVLAVACWNPADYAAVAASAKVSTGDEDSETVGFWLSRQPRWLHLSPFACGQIEALYATRQPTGTRAFALTTMLHETLHAYGFRSEAQTNCFAVQLVPVAALEMGFTPPKARYLGQLAVRKTRSTAPRGYWDATRCRDGGAWDLLPETRTFPS